jgi:hypothetical protein
VETEAEVETEVGEIIAEVEGAEGVEETAEGIVVEATRATGKRDGGSPTLIACPRSWGPLNPVEAF